MPARMKAKNAAGMCSVKSSQNTTGTSMIRPSVMTFGMVRAGSRLTRRSSPAAERAGRSRGSGASAAREMVRA
jgi:hypothetical protein